MFNAKLSIDSLQPDHNEQKESDNIPKGKGNCKTVTVLYI